MARPKISIIGSGVVGEATGLAFAEKGFEVVFYDICVRRVRRLSQICEATDKLAKAIDKTDVSIVCVPTPTLADGSFDYSYLRSVSEDIAKCMPTRHTFLYKSTLLPGSLRNIVFPLLSKVNEGGTLGDHIALANNPEFLTEKYALEDARHPSRIVIGLMEGKVGDYNANVTRLLSSIYAPFNAPIFFTTPEEAEMVKYWANLELASHISFTNEMGLICDTWGLDANYISSIVRLDPRLGTYGSTYGAPYGGKCLPKDLNAFLTSTAKDGIDTPMLEAIRKVNRKMGGE